MGTCKVRMVFWKNPNPETVMVSIENSKIVNKTQVFFGNNALN
jgi:hypothetical protein